MLINPGRSPSALLQQQRIQVRAVGETVELQIGNAVIGLPYETALQLSQWLRVRAKEAKRLAGDQSRHWSVVALLEGIKP